MTVLSFERYPVEPKSIATFEDLVGRLLDRARAAPGALWADAARAFDDDPSYVVLSEWRTEGDLEGFESSDAVASFRDEADVMLRGESTRRTWVG